MPYFIFFTSLAAAARYIPPSLVNCLCFARNNNMGDEQCLDVFSPIGCTTCGPLEITQTYFDTCTSSLFNPLTPPTLRDCANNRVCGAECAKNYLISNIDTCNLAQGPAALTCADWGRLHTTAPGGCLTPAADAMEEARISLFAANVQSCCDTIGKS